MEIAEYKMTYYVGAMLAHGGVLMIQEDKLVFSPGTIERAMGASDTVIPFEQIKLVEVTGTITESLIVRTQDKAHRFVGSEPYQIRDKINSAVQRALQFRKSIAADSAEVSGQVSLKESISPPIPPAISAPPSQMPVTPSQCPSCSKPTRREFNFCPFCHALLKAVCPKCYKTTEKDWKFCAFCNSSL